MNSSPPRPEKKLAPHSLTWFYRWFFQRLYHQLSWAYDFIASVVSLGLWHDWIQSVIPYLHGSVILELGHGPGHLQVALHQAGKQSIGLDQSKQMGSQAHRRLMRAGLPIYLMRARAEQLPLASNSIPQVVATFPSEYIAHQAALAEIFRVLIPGSSAVVLLLAWITGESLLERLAAWTFRVTRESSADLDQYFDPARAAGFIVQNEYITLPTSRLLIIQLKKPD